MGKDYGSYYPTPRLLIEALIAREKAICLQIGKLPYLIQKHLEHCSTTRSYSWRVTANLEDVWYN